MAAKCSSYIHCGGHVAAGSPPGEKWCLSCREHLDRVKRSINPRRFDKGQGMPASVTVTHTPRKRKPQQKSVVYRERILAVLAAGPLYSTELLERCGSADEERSLKRVRRMMLKAGEIVEGPQQGHQRQYALA
jgi:hypothetical protein